jgi:hypothetical protein
VGRVALVHQPVRLAAGPPPAPGVPRVRVGLDALGVLAPTFDAGAGVLTLRGSGRVRAPRSAAHLPAVVAPDGVYVPVDAGLVSLGSAAGRRAVPAARRWTYDGRRGEVLVER